MVKPIDVRNTDILHGFLLNQLYPLLPLCYGSSTCTRGIQDRAYFPFRDQCVEHHLVQFPDPFGRTFVDVYRVIPHLVDNLLVSHFHDLIYLSLRGTKLLHHLTYLLTVYFGILNRHLTHDVKIQFQHLSDFLIEGHLRECLLNLCLQCRITRNSGLLCLCCKCCAT